MQTKAYEQHMSYSHTRSKQIQFFTNKIITVTISKCRVYVNLSTLGGGSSLRVMDLRASPDLDPEMRTIATPAGPPPVARA